MFLFSLANELWALYRRQLIILGILLLVLKFIPTEILNLVVEWNKCGLIDCPFWGVIPDFVGDILRGIFG